MTKTCIYLSTALCMATLSVNAQRTYLDQTTIDRSIKPGNDFFAYANGGWINANEIPATEASWGNWAIVRKQTRLRLQELIKDLSQQKNKPGSDARKLADFYRAGMDTLTRNKRGVGPVLADLQRIDAISNRQGITNEVIAQYASGMAATAPLFSLANLPDPISNDNEIITFTQRGMGLPEKSYYTDTSEKALGIRTKYTQLLQQLLQLSGVSEGDAAAKAATVLALETRLATGARTATENRNIMRLLNYYTPEKLASEFPNIGWNDLFLRLGIQSGKIIVGQPEFFANLNQQLETTPLSVWKDYLKVRLLNNVGNALSTPFINARLAFYSTALNGVTQTLPFGELVTNSIDQRLGEMLGKLYVEKYFPASAKKRMDDLVQNVITTFGERINSNAWMTDPTKEKARQKLSTIRRKIAYPDKWIDYSSVTIGTNYYENVQAAAAFDFARRMSLVGKPVDRDQWAMSPPTLNAYYSPLNNEIVFPAGILLAPFFDPDADDAVNYGGIATVIGHEISHGFDDQGSQFNEQGKFSNWWTKADKASFDAKGAALATQFNQYVAVDTLHVNGKLTLGENIGDLCGLTVAYQAFKKTEQGKGKQLIDGLTPDQRFFLAYAAIWRTKQRQEGTRTQVLTDPHAPARFRVNGPLSNFDAFYSAFSIKEGDPMWRPVSERVVIW